MMAKNEIILYTQEDKYATPQGETMIAANKYAQEIKNSFRFVCIKTGELKAIVLKYFLDFPFES